MFDTFELLDRARELAGSDELCVHCFEATLGACAEVAERRIAELERERDEAQMEYADALIEVRDRLARPDDVVVIDGQRWRVEEVRAGDAPSLRHATLVPVEDGEPITTKTGRVLTDSDIEALSDEAEAGYDLPATVEDTDESA